MNKQEARRHFRSLRQSLTSAERNRFDDLLLIGFQSLDLPFIQSVLTYAAIDAHGEPPTGLLTRYLQFLNPELQIAYPRTNWAENSFDAIATGDDPVFQLSDRGIPEPPDGEIIAPEELDMVIVPLLAFDRHGYRVGYGKGFYDRYLAQCGSHCLFAGLSYFEPVEKIADANEFDIPLDICITPQNVYVF